MTVVHEIVSLQATTALLCEDARARGGPECAGPVAELGAVMDEFAEIVRDGLAAEVRELRERVARLHRLAGDAARTVDDVRAAGVVGGAVVALGEALEVWER